MSPDGPAPKKARHEEETVADDIVTDDMATAYINDFVVEGPDKKKETPSVLVAVNDFNGAGLVAEGGDLMRHEELVRRSKQTSLDGSLIRIRPNEHALCMGLRFLQKRVNRAVFLNDRGDPMKWVENHVRNGLPVVAYFKHADTCAEKTNLSGVPSLKHERAIDLMISLVVKNRLRVETRCSFEHHARRPLPAWASSAGTDPLEVNGHGPGLSVVRSFRWCGFELDAAVLKNGELYIAIEAEKGHKNSQKKKDAFKEHRILNVQISADEVVRAFKPSADVVVAHHPNTRCELFVCSLCAPAKELRRASRLTLSDMKERENAERKAFEQETFELTTLEDPEVGKAVKSFLNLSSRPTHPNVGGHLSDGAGVKVAVVLSSAKLLEWRTHGLTKTDGACFIIENVQRMTAEDVSIFRATDYTDQCEKAEVGVGAKVVRVGLLCTGTNLPEFSGYVASEKLAGPLSEGDTEILVRSGIDEQHWGEITGM